jgi:hypothetical protein
MDSSKVALALCGRLPFINFDIFLQNRVFYSLNLMLCVTLVLPLVRGRGNPETLVSVSTYVVHIQMAKSWPECGLAGACDGFAAIRDIAECLRRLLVAGCFPPVRTT